MVEPKGITEKASEIATQVVHAAGPAIEKASDLAVQAAEAAGPAIEKAKEVAGELVEKAAPLVEKAKEVAAHGVSTAAEQIDKATGGRYADRISTVSAKIEGALERDKPTPGERVTPPAE